MRSVLPTREYKSGTEWCAWRWTYTPSGYITRLHLLKTPWCALMVHWINGPDAEPHMHDHPVTFLSIFLSGGYTELRNGTSVMRTLMNYIRATDTDIHRITDVLPNTITLCLVGPKVREWGFHTPEGWIHWKEYNRRYKA